MTDETPQILQRKPGEPGGEKARELAEQLANDIVRTVLVNRNVDEECAVGFARDVLRPVLAGALAACALEARADEAAWWAPYAEQNHTRGCSLHSTDGPDGDFCSCGLAQRRALMRKRWQRLIDAVAINESAPVGVKEERAAEGRA